MSVARMHMHGERAGFTDGERVCGKLGRRLGYRRMLDARTPAVQASLYSHTRSSGQGCS